MCPSLSTDDGLQAQLRVPGAQATPRKGQCPRPGLSARRQELERPSGLRQGLDDLQASVPWGTFQTPQSATQW